MCKADVPTYSRVFCLFQGRRLIYAADHMFAPAPKYMEGQNLPVLGALPEASQSDRVGLHLDNRAPLHRFCYARRLPGSLPFKTSWRHPACAREQACLVDSSSHT